MLHKKTFDTVGHHFSLNSTEILEQCKIQVYKDTVIIRPALA